ncbi:DUF6973 domain-containing protein [Hymenobacter cheonanensis]|uniref:DUF6973 domain-containing protein n=1 Tax=Hymenobacter sp. CA2-7 TaxID=3063993 RepID=UPI00272B1077|nr:hypothetical protein [Hymenobacter sp. CA2-7]
MSGSGTRWVVPINDAIAQATANGGLAAKRYGVFSRENSISGYVIEVYAKKSTDVGKQLVEVIDDVFSTSVHVNNTFEGAIIVYDIRYNYLFGKEYALGKKPTWGVHVKKAATAIIKAANKPGSPSQTLSVSEPDGDGNCGAACTKFTISLSLGVFDYCDCPEPGDGGGGGYGGGGYGGGGYGGDGGGGGGYGPGEGGYYPSGPDYGGGGPSVPDSGYGGSTDPIMQEYETLESNYRGRMSATEIVIFDRMSFVDRFNYLFNAQNAEDLAGALFSTSSLVNGPGDAFRHAYFVARNTIDIGQTLALQLSNAHEEKPNNNPIEKEMDLENNRSGIIIGEIAISNSQTGIVEVKAVVLDWLGSHLLVIIENGTTVPSHL